METGRGPSGRVVKRFRSAYIFFVKENFKKVAAASTKKNGRNKRAKYVLRELGKRWRCLSAAERCKFEVMAQKDRARWQREMRERNRPGGPSGQQLQQLPPPEDDGQVPSPAGE